MGAGAEATSIERAEAPAAVHCPVSSTLPDLALVLGPLGWFLLLAGYENLTAPLFALSLQCKAEVTAPAPGGSQ
jgi:hypothetical protein